MIISKVTVGHLKPGDWTDDHKQTIECFARDASMRCLYVGRDPFQGLHVETSVSHCGFVQVRWYSLIDLVIIGLR